MQINFIIYRCFTTSGQKHPLQGHKVLYSLQYCLHTEYSCLHKKPPNLCI